MQPTDYAIYYMGSNDVMWLDDAEIFTPATDSIKKQPRDRALARAAVLSSDRCAYFVTNGTLTFEVKGTEIKKLEKA